MSPAARAARDTRIVAERLTYAAPDGRTLFHELTFALDGDRTGLVGVNGSGKSTLIKLLSGELAPSSGSVRRVGTFAVLPQDFRPPPNAPLAEVLGIAERLAAIARLERGEARASDFELVGDDWDLPDRVSVVLAQLGLAHLPLDRPMRTVSGGEATRVALAGLELAHPDIILLDEPTNHLDSANRDALCAFVERWSGQLLCVSHDRALLRRMDRIVEISSLGVREYGGNYDDYRARRDADDAAASRELESARAAAKVAAREAQVVRERQAHREAQGRQRAKTANMPKILLGGLKRQAQATTARVRAISEREVDERRERVAMARRAVEERERPRFALPSTGLPNGRRVLALDRVTVRFESSRRAILEQVSLQLVGPERVAIVGANGSGKTTLLRVVMGWLAPDEGTVHRLPDDETGYLDQHGCALDPARSVLENYCDHHPRMDATRARHALARFLFSDEAALQRVATLSGGERLRASLACVLGGERPPSLLVLDEPTNHLDLDAMEALEHALRSYDGAMLVVSHDGAFLDAIGVERRVHLGGEVDGEDWSDREVASE